MAKNFSSLTAILSNSVPIFNCQNLLASCGKVFLLYTNAIGEELHRLFIPVDSCACRAGHPDDRDPLRLTRSNFKAVNFFRFYNIGLPSSLFSFAPKFVRIGKYA